MVRLYSADKVASRSFPLASELSQSAWVLTAICIALPVFSCPPDRCAHTRTHTRRCTHPPYQSLRQCCRILADAGEPPLRHGLGGCVSPRGSTLTPRTWPSLQAPGVQQPGGGEQRLTVRPHGPAPAPPRQQLHLPDPPRRLELLPEAARAVSVPFWLRRCFVDTARR